MIGRTNVGGSGLLETNAILRVVVKTGSSVTATKSGKTLTPKIWTQNADNTLDTAIFSIPSSTFDSNPWTVTATLGSDTASNTVIIDSANEYDVMLFYNFYIVRNGVLINTLKSETNVTVSQESGYVKVLTPINRVGLAITDPITGVSQYTKIICEIVGTESRNWNSGEVPSFGYSYVEPSVNTSSGAVSNKVGYKRFTVGSNNAITADTYELAFTPSTTNYLYIDVSGVTSFSGRADIYNLYMTK